jgi:ferrous iron transport protein B
MKDAAGSFLWRAGTMILASMIVVWALLYFPATNGKGERYEELLTQKQQAADGGAFLAGGLLTGSLNDAVDDDCNALRAEWKGNSILGQTGKFIEPAVVPLGWDWRIGMAALASFPAREVVVGTLGVIFSQGDVDADEIRHAHDVTETGLGKAMVDAKWAGTDRPLFTVPAALSLMVFFALCCQCASTLAVIRRETRSWAWPAFTFAYMTALAYVGALVTFQVGTLLERLAGA